MFRAEAWWTIALILTGAVGGLVYNWPAGATEQDSQSTIRQTAQHPDLIDESRGLTLTTENRHDATRVAPVQLESLRTGDRFLSGGNYIGAYQHYTKIRKQSDHSRDGSIQVRLGLASELAGFLEQSEGHYRSTIQSANATPIEKAWGLIGTARIWHSQGRLDEAISLLSELYLMYGTEAYPTEIRLPINRLLVECLQQRYLKRANDTDKRLPPVQYYWGNTWIDPVLSDAVTLPADRPAAAESKLSVIQKPINDIALILVDAQLRHESLLKLTGDLAQAVDMKFETSPHARAALSGRSIRTDAHALPVSVLLDQALSPLNLVWQQNNGTVSILHDDELDPLMQDRLEMDRIQRLLRQLQLNFNNGTERIAALMNDANNCFVLGTLESAANKYQAARDLKPMDELSALLYFNHATLEQTLHHREIALDKFYRALDQTLSPTLQASCYANIADLELTLGRPGKAIAAASRGLRMSADSDQSSENLMTLAIAYLVEGDPFSANRILFTHSASLTDPRSKRLASVIATFARYQAVGPTRGLQNEGERLVMALAAITPTDARNFVEHLILSRAFAAVGFRTKAIEHLSVATNLVEGGYWENRSRLELSEVLFEASELERANEAVETILQTADVAFEARVRLLDAQIKLGLGRYADCEAICTRLLKLPLDTDSKKQALDLMGQSYQAMDKHYSAALCFAGLMPESASDIPSDHAKQTR
ncbi:MAG: hypothetical protein HKN47_16870 [Pirellulaceae bacterium]|nr:hypothetical protein [Pirellulaceae bacterium]